MTLLIAEAEFRYSNKPLKPGDEFEASEKDARILKLAKRARDPRPGDRKRSGGRYQRRDMLAVD